MSEAQQSQLAHLTERERQIVTEFVRRLHQQFEEQLLSAVLFGSRARGDAEPDSDMDLLVVLRQLNHETRKAVRYLAADLWLTHDVYLSTRVYSAAEWARLQDMNTLLYRNIRRDGIELLDPTPLTT